MLKVGDKDKRIMENGAAGNKLKDSKYENESRERERGERKSR